MKSTMTETARFATLKRCAAAAATIALIAATGVFNAVAAPGNGSTVRPFVAEPTTVSDCLSYSSPASYFISDFVKFGHNVYFHCGDSTAGVHHTNIGHAPLDNTYFGACVNLAMNGGYQHQSNGNYLFDNIYGYNGQYYNAYVVAKTSNPYVSGEWSIITAYTPNRSVPGGTSNDWVNCGKYARVAGYYAQSRTIRSH